MLAVALPALRAVWTPVDSSVIPKGQSARTVADTLSRDFGGQDTSPVTIALDAPAGERAAVAEFAAGLEPLPGVRRGRPAAAGRLDLAGRRGRGRRARGRAAQALVQQIRALPAPYPLLVGGAAAEFVDQQDAIASSLPLAVGLLVVLTFAVLWLMTGSIVLPAKAILMNALTVGSALGVVTFVFQDGRFEGLLGYTATAASSRRTSSSRPRWCSRCRPTTASSCSVASRRRGRPDTPSARPSRSVSSAPAPW